MSVSAGSWELPVSVLLEALYICEVLVFGRGHLQLVTVRERSWVPLRCVPVWALFPCLLLACSLRELWNPLTSLGLCFCSLTALWGTVPGKWSKEKAGGRNLPLISQTCFVLFGCLFVLFWGGGVCLVCFFLRMKNKNISSSIHRHRQIETNVWLFYHLLHCDTAKQNPKAR